MPKLPKLSTIKSTKVDNPSGLKGKMKKFTPKKLNAAKAYPNAPSTKTKTNVPKTNVKPYISTSWGGIGKVDGNKGGKLASLVNKKKGKK